MNTCFFFFNDPATPEIYPLSLHDALPILAQRDSTALVATFLPELRGENARLRSLLGLGTRQAGILPPRSEEHTSELQSQSNLVCRLLLGKKKRKTRQCPPFWWATSSTPAT